MNRPKIAVIFHRKIRDNYGKTLWDAGGLPFYLGTIGQGKDYLSSMDGLLLAGGGDPLPLLFQEEFSPNSGVPDVARDYFEKDAVLYAVEKKMPVLGICRGMQMINIALGGSIYQDIGSSHCQKTNPMTTSHGIRIEKNSHLHEILQQDSLEVNSFHHQSIKDMAPALRKVAFGEDGVVEAIEGDGIMGFQWHIEWLNYREEEQKIFRNFVGRAYDYSQKTGINKIK